ncbi:MAG: calcium-binding protein [Sulfurovaceae bacterium]
MAKAIQLITKSDTKQISTVTAGMGKTGNTLIIKAQADVKYELRDVATKHALQHLSFVRKGKDLWIKIKDDKDPLNTTDVPDIIIENYYNYSTINLVGFSKNGQYFNYVAPKDISDLFAIHMDEGQFSFYSPGSILVVASILGLVSLIDVSQKAKPNNSAEDIMPVEAFENMMTIMIDTFSERMQNSDDPFIEMANTMGSMMYSFMDGLTGNTAEASVEGFALTMGEAIHQFMIGLTGSDENFAQTLGDVMGSMVGSMMSKMTGNTEAPLQSFMTIMNDSMSRFMNEMSTNINSIISPIIDMMNTMLTSIDGNIETIETMFAATNETMQSMIEMSPDYMMTILRLSDDIGLMADRIGEMADRIVDTQVIQSENFLSTQENALRLIEILLSQPEPIQSMAGFDVLVWDITSAIDTLQSISNGYDVFPDDIYIQDSSGILSMIKESDLIQEDGSAVNISNFLNDQSIVVGYTIPNLSLMNISDLSALMTFIQSQTYSIQDLPMIPTQNGIVSIAQMNSIMSLIMGMFIGAQFTSNYDTIDESALSEITEPFMSMVEIFIDEMNMDAMVPMINYIRENLISMMSDPDMIESLPYIAQTMMNSMSDTVASVESFDEMMVLIMDIFTSKILAEGNMFDNMANTMGSMMYSFMDGLTGNTAEASVEGFALTMGEAIHQFMIGLTGSDENFAQTLGDVMGSMVGSMMSKMTGNTEAPLQSFMTIMNDSMSRFMNEMSTNINSIISPIIDMMNTMLTSIDGNIETIETMFAATNETMQSMIEMSPDYMMTILRLSDDIGLMADRIGEMADRIVDTQVIQSENFLSTQENALRLIEIMIENQTNLTDQIGIKAFTEIMDNLNKINSVISSLIFSNFSAESILPSQLYLQTPSGELIAISESDLLNADVSADISEFLNGNQLLVGFTIPNAPLMTLNKLIEYVAFIQNGGLDMSQLPMLGFTAQDVSMIDMSSIMNSIIGMFMATWLTSSQSLDPSVTSSFITIIEDFMSDMGNMTIEQFSSLMNQTITVISGSTMIDSMMQMSDSMMEMTTDLLSEMSLNSFNTMTSTAIQSIDSTISVTNTPIDAMGYTMGSIIFSFMRGLSQNEEELTNYELARMMGDISQQFMAEVTGNINKPAAAMGEMMGSMMGAFMASITGDSQDPLGTFIDNMMKSQFINDFTDSTSWMMKSMVDVMDTMLITIQGNTDYIISMLEILNDSAQDMIQMSPTYIATILRLSDDIGLMADRIGEMAGRIVQTEVIQSANFLTTQQNTMELITMLNESSFEFEPTTNEMLRVALENLTKFQNIMNNVSIAAESLSSTIVPNDLYLINDLGELMQISKTDLVNYAGSTDISLFLDQANLLVGYTIPFNSSMTLADLSSMAQMIEVSGFSLEQLPIFANATSIMDINTFMESMFTTDTLNMIDLPIDQFNQMIQNFQSHIDLGVSPMDIIGQTAGSMINAFMNNMIQADMMQTSLEFVELMGNTVREFMIGITGSQEVPAMAMGEMIGSMIGSFMASITGDELTPMNSFAQTIIESFVQLADTASQNILTIMDPTIELMEMFVNDMNTYMDLFILMFENSDATIDVMIDQIPSYLDTMLRLSSDIGLMTDRIGEMADRIVDTQMIMSENFLATQQNAISLMSLLTENSDVIQDKMGSESFIAMISTLSNAIIMLDTIAASSIPQDYKSALYLQNADGEIIQLSSAQLLLNDSFSFEVASMLDGSTLLVGYTIPASSIMSMNEWMDITKIPYGITNITTLPILDPNINLDMNDIFRSIMNMMMGNAIGIPMEQSISAPFMSIMESFANGMGLSIDEFETMFDSIMETMMVNDMVAAMKDIAQEVIALTYMDQFFAPEVIVDTIMNTFMTEGTPIAMMAEMLGSMMNSLIGGTGFEINATPIQTAYNMGEMMKSFMVGFTGNQENLAIAIGEMIGSTMEAFMDAVTGEGEDFTTIINSLKEQMVTEITANMSALIDPVNDLFLVLSEEMDQTITQMQSMMIIQNDNMQSILDQNDTFISAMSAISQDIIEMSLKIEDMIRRVDQTIKLQTNNFITTQNNLNALVDSLLQLYTSSSIEFMKSGMGEVLNNLMTAQITMETSLANIGLLSEYETMPGLLKGSLEDDIKEGLNTADYIFGFKGNDIINGDSGNDILDGGAGNDTISGGDGNDILNGGDGIDLLFGDASDDQIVYDASDSIIDGGTGIDTLYIAGSGVTLDLTTIADTKIIGIEKIDITGSGNNTLKLNYSDLLALSNTGDVLYVTGNGGDMVTLTGAVFTGSKTLDNIIYNTYNIGGTSFPNIWIQQEIIVV